MLFSLVQMSVSQMQEVAEARVPAELALRVEHGALPPPFVCARSLEQVAAGNDQSWCNTFLIVRGADDLGFEALPRPAVRLPGYWLGVNGHVHVHMGLDEKALAADQADKATNSGRNTNSVVDHIGFIATAPESFSEHFRRLGVPARERYIASMKLLQIILTDPDGLTIELNFPDIAVEPSWMRKNTP